MSVMILDRWDSGIKTTMFIELSDVFCVDVWDNRDLALVKMRNGMLYEIHRKDADDVIAGVIEDLEDSDE